MGNAQKPTPQTCHIDIKYFSLCLLMQHHAPGLHRHIYQHGRPPHRGTTTYPIPPPCQFGTWPRLTYIFPCPYSQITHPTLTYLFLHLSPPLLQLKLCAYTALKRRTFSTTHGSVTSAWIVQSTIPHCLVHNSLWGGVTI
jgi:hypothetical protein